MELQLSESKLKGNWIFENNEIKKDVTALRIDYLKDNYLIKIGTDVTGWDILYQDPLDQRYWELVYPNSEMQGGGPPLLQHISIDMVKNKYHIDV